MKATQGRLCAGVSLLALTILAAMPVHADTRTGEAATVPEIVVTAEKRSESIRSLPISISAYSGATLSSSGVRDVRDLQAISPNLDIGAKGSETFISIRGIGSEVASIGSEPGVTVSQDDVPFARHLFFDPDFMDTSRVEVLRGPQGVISGRNATGGAIRLVSNEPTRQPDAGLTATVGNYSRFSTDGFVSGPLDGDVLLGRFAFRTDNADGWLRDTRQNQSLGKQDAFHGRLTLLAEPTPRFEARLILEGLFDHGLPQATENVGRANPDLPSLGEFFSNLLGTEIPDANVQALTLQGDQSRRYGRQQLGANLQFIWRLGPSSTLTSTSGYWRLDVNDAQDTDGTLVSIGDFPMWRWRLWQFTQELTLTTPITPRLDLVAGGLYMREHAEQPLEYVATVLGIGPGGYVTHPVQDLTSYSAYGQLRYALTEKLRVSAGLRFTDDRKSYFEQATILGSALEGGASHSWPAATPRFSLDYQPSRDLTLFVNVARGFKAGGYNTLTFGRDRFNPEYVWSYEGGVKADLLQRRLYVAATGFYMDYTNLQQTLYTAGPFGVPQANVVNVPRARIDGVEVEADAVPTQGLNLGLSASWLDTRLGDLVTVDPTDATPTPRNLGGNALPRSPRWQLSAKGPYEFPLGPALTGELAVQYGWRSHQFFEIFNDPLIAQNAYGLLNLTAAVSTRDGHWRAILFGRNVTDERYLTNAFASVIFPGVPMKIASIGEPRMYGVSLSYRY